MSTNQHRRLARRTFRSGMIAVSIALGSMTFIAAVRPRPHDTRFDDADAALEKAQILLGAASCVSSTDKATKDCEKYVAKAIAAIDDARNDVASAGEAQDSGGLTKQ